MLERVKARKPPNRASFFCQAYAAPPAFTPRWTASIIKLRGHKFKLCRNKGAPVDFVHAERFLDWYRIYGTSSFIVVRRNQEYIVEIVVWQLPHIIEWCDGPLAPNVRSSLRAGQNMGSSPAFCWCSVRSVMTSVSSDNVRSCPCVFPEQLELDASLGSSSPCANSCAFYSALLSPAVPVHGPQR